MIFRRENIDLPEDRGCLQWVLGVPLALIYLPAVYLCFLMLVAEPGDPNDDRMRDDTAAGAYLVVGISLFGLLLSLLPVYRRTMGRWWYAAPLVLGLIAYIRAKTV